MRGAGAELVPREDCAAGVAAGSRGGHDRPVGASMHAAQAPAGRRLRVAYGGSYGASQRHGPANHSESP